MSRRNNYVPPKAKDESLFQTESELVASENQTVSDEPQAMLIRIPPFSYIHVLNTNNNVTRLEVGPKSLTCMVFLKKFLTYPRFGSRKSRLRTCEGNSYFQNSIKKKTVVIPPRHYCIITNPVTLDDKNQVIVDKYGQAKLRHGDSEIRFSNHSILTF